MDPVVTVDTDSVSVEPGGQASLTVRVRNVSSIVEGFRIDVLGEASPWARVLPDHLEVLPQGEGIATVLFSPPSGVATRAGAVPFGVRATSQVDATASAVAEGDLAVGGVSLSQAKISPVTSKGRFSAKHRVEFSNWGNTPVRLKLDASDPDNALGFLVTPEYLDLPLGTSGQAKVKVRARKPQMRGTPLRRTFRVVGRPLAPGSFEPAPGPAPAQYGYDPSVPAVDGAFEQRAVLGRGLIPLVVTALLVAGGIGYLLSRNQKQAAEETVAPPPPSAFVANAISPDTVRLKWQPGERAETYTIFTIDPTTKATPVPIATNRQDVPGDIGQLDVPGLPQGTEQCFQITTTRGEATSARSEPACVTLPVAAAPGAPATPTNLSVEAAPDGKARITWADPTEGASHIIRRGDTVVDEIAPPAQEALVDLLPDERCFTVQAHLGDQFSEETQPKCVAAAEGNETGNQNGGNGTSLGIVALPTTTGFGPKSADDTAGRTLAEQDRADLFNLGFEDAVLILSTDYSGLQAEFAHAQWLAVIPFFENPQDALDACAGAGLQCETFTPDTARDGAQPPVSGPPA